MNGDRRPPWKLIAGVCAAGAAVAIGRLAWSSLGDASFARADWRYAALSALCMLAFVLIYAAAWALLVRALELDGPRFWPAFRLFLLTWPGRYLPASVPHYGGRLAAGPRIGLSRSAVGASLVYENLFAIAVSGSLSIALLAFGFRDALRSDVWILAAIGAAGLSLLALQPFVVRRVLRVAGSRVRRLRPLEEHVLPARGVVRISFVYAAGTVAAGLAFYFALRAVSGGDAPPLLLAVAAYNIAGVAGMLAIAVPGGIGVREGVSVAIIGGALSPEAAISAAVLARLAGVVADLAPFACIALAHLVMQTTKHGRVARASGRAAAARGADA